ncbi:hypothetical protein RND81_04G126600 [Saponaria officinalis]|uniref:Non-specific lipid-transfer protein n=1 Tax=Saponaria officinalis TaxID=3572 RepID=A0AAW1LNH0_SAPOF
MTTLKKLVCMIMLCMVVMTTHGKVGAVAITCGGVTKSLAPCMAYIRGSSGVTPPAKCCAGVRALKGMARTPADRKTACNCMKTAAGRIKGLNYGNANKLAPQCGVTISYTFSPNTNCNTYVFFFFFVSYGLYFWLLSNYQIFRAEHV